MASIARSLAWSTTLSVSLFLSPSTLIFKLSVAAFSGLTPAMISTPRPGQQLAIGRAVARAQRLVAAGWRGMGRAGST